MALVEAHWSSPTLRKKVGTTLLLPDVGKPPFPVFYLLHGLSDDHTIWTRYTRLEQYVRQLPLVVVMPDGFRGFYTDNANGPAYARYIADDLTGFVERHFPVKTTRSARCIGGLSMGGYGALRIALAHPDRYVSANSHSGAVGYGDTFDPKTGSVLPEWEFRNIFGHSPGSTDHDLRHLVRRAKRAKRLPQLLIDCGTEDFLLPHNRKFHDDLTRLKVPHTYREFPGDHNWDYWDQHVRDALDFHCKALRLPRT
jgi:S-formylglutathione hydrolase FrmB